MLLFPLPSPAAWPLPRSPGSRRSRRRIEPATLDCAEKIFGVDFTDAEEQAAAAGVGRNLASFEQLRELIFPRHRTGHHLPPLSAGQETERSGDSRARK